MISHPDLVVLAVGAHPDDVEVTCAGTLAALVRRGCTVHVAVATGGECGSFTHDGPGARAERLEEARQAASILGASSFHHLGMSDQGTETSIQRRAELTDLVRTLGANLLISHAPGDYHVDHRRTHELVNDVRMAAAVPNFASAPPLPATPDLLFMDTVAGLGFEPHVWIDIDETIDVRRSMLRAHVSQVELMRRMYDVDLIEMSETLARLRGVQRGSGYAEAFRGCGTFPEPDGGIRRLLRAVGQ